MKKQEYIENLNDDKNDVRKSHYFENKNIIKETNTENDSSLIVGSLEKGINSLDSNFSDNDFNKDEFICKEFDRTKVEEFNISHQTCELKETDNKYKILHDRENNCTENIPFNLYHDKYLLKNQKSVNKFEYDNNNPNDTNYTRNKIYKFKHKSLSTKFILFLCRFFLIGLACIYIYILCLVVFKIIKKLKNARS